MSKNNIQVSIVTINYNHAAGLEKTMASVLKQKFIAKEYIVIDGGSNDGSKNIIEQHADKLDYWVSEKDSGIYNAMNKGIAKAKGEYVLFLNSGDYLLDEDVLNVVFSENRKEDILYANLKTDNRIITFPSILNFSFFFRDSIGHPAAFVKRKLFVLYGMYNEENKIVSDWEFFIKTILINKVSYAYINKEITYYESDGISSNERTIKLHEGERENVLRKYFSQFYPALVAELTEQQHEINRYKNSRAIKKVTSIMNSGLYQFFKGKSSIF
jgi:glycosyltransferase involved in cell wall biosynthesis